MKKVNWEKGLKNSTRIIIDVKDIDTIVNNEYVKKLRKKLGVTQTVFSRGLGVSKKAVEKWEQGVNKVNPATKRLLYLLDRNPSLFDEFYKKEVTTLSKSLNKENKYTVIFDYKITHKPVQQQNKEYRYFSTSNEERDVAYA